MRKPVFVLLQDLIFALYKKGYVQYPAPLPFIRSDPLTLVLMLRLLPLRLRIPYEFPTKPLETPWMTGTV